MKEIKDKYYIYGHSCDGKPFYIGFGSKLRNDLDYSRAFDIVKRSDPWKEVFNDCDDFHIEIVEESNDKLKMSFLERALVLELGRKINEKDGYLVNIVPGGYHLGGGRNPLKIAKYDYKGNLITVFDNIHLATNSINRCSEAIYNCCNKASKSCAGFVWRYWNNESTIDPLINRKIVYCYDRQLRFIKEYRSCKEASRQLKIDEASIRNNCLGNRKSAGGYIWSYTPTIAKENGWSEDRLS